MPKKLISVFSISFSAKIWNLLTDHDAHYLYLELRDEEAHQVSFAAYQLTKKEMVWQDLRFKESWWIGMSVADQDILVLHTFENSDNPDEKSFLAFDVNTQQIIWESENLQVIDVKNRKIYGYEKVEGDTVYKCISLEDEAEKEISKEEAFAALQNFSVENKYIRHPFHYTEEDAYFETVRKFVLEYLNLQPIKGCEYLEHQQFIYISYYIQENKALANYLLVIDKEGTLQLHEKMDDQLSQLGLGTFMIIRNQLMFIKRKRELVSYAI
ncbi:hypothetical protein OKW21_005362 [Catalinimonas alkaloidigena]|uniref:DUF4905 domain-containing protein n=1 Tax=Catalinimonas alkaloidigena TaxID=1075417 RepID=UPI00240757FD|nr:DUF4905 domain-containing protein [Catalinimonas alkaloidigena]MDF9800099.1 hypothetical protein [Catalinimonas alkaloidigena]